MVRDRWTFTRLMAEVMVNTMVLVLWRNLKYSRCRMNFPLEQNHLLEIIVSEAMRSLQRSLSVVGGESRFSSSWMDGWVSVLETSDILKWLKPQQAWYFTDNVSNFTLAAHCFLLMLLMCCITCCLVFFLT